MPRPCLRRSVLLASAMVVWLGAALSGCASLIPDYRAPALPVADTYSDATTGSGTDSAPAGAEEAGVDAAAIAWRDYFTDTTLQGLIEQALAHNRDVRTAALRVEEARAAYRIQRAEGYPTVGGEASGSRSRTPADLNLTGRPLTAGEYRIGLGVSQWEIDFWGRIASLKAAALHDYLATDEARRAATVALVAQVADTYLNLRQLDERIALAHQTIDSREASARIFQRRVEVGATARLDLIQVQTLLAQARTLAVQLEQARAAERHALALLVGDTVAGPLLSASPAPAEPIRLPAIRAGLPSALLLARPDIMAAEHQLRAAYANIGAARAAFFPRVTLTGFAGTASAELDGLFDGGSGAWRFAPGLSVPLFDAGRNRAALALSEVRRDMAVADYEKRIQTAFREVADALSAGQWLTEQVGIQDSILSAQRERARLAQLRYDHGASRYLEVLDAQRDLLSAEQQSVQTRYALLASRVALYAALGGGAQSLDAEAAQGAAAGRARTE